MPFGVFFCGGLQALEGLLVQGRDFSRPNNSAPSRPPDRAQVSELAPSSKAGGSKAQKEGGGPAPKGGPPPV